MVALFEAAHDGFDVRLPGPGDEELVGLWVAIEANQQVFFHELMNGGRELVFIGAGLGLDGIGHRRFGQRGEVDLNVAALLPQRVAGKGIAQLGYRAEIAGMQLGDFNRLAALHDAKVREALLAAARVVLERCIAFDHAAHHLEKGDASRRRDRSWF